MKTLKTLFIAVLLVSTSVVTFANQKNEMPVIKASSHEELKESIVDLFQDDFRHYNNYFFQNGIYNFDETVEIDFRVMPDQKIYIYRVACNDYNGVEYVKSILENVIVDVDEDLMNQNYNITIQLEY
ncbi:MAG: hypothetical protein JXR48_00020 [Candidatus Delongbacteria bacterium]|nr:hypothetical protein [Candidatus Delongbacteria bacterium]